MPRVLLELNFDIEVWSGVGSSSHFASLKTEGWRLGQLGVGPVLGKWVSGILAVARVLIFGGAAACTGVRQWWRGGTGVGAVGELNFSFCPVDLWVMLF